MNDFGKIPPQAIDAEECVLGSCLVDSDVTADIASILTPEMFYKTANQHIYKAIIDSMKSTGYSDLVVVTDKLTKSGLLEAVGGPVYIVTLTNKIVHSGHAFNMALIVKEKYLAREYIRIAHQLSDKAFVDDIADVTMFAENEIYKLSESTQRSEFCHISVPIDEQLIEIDKIMKKEISVIGIPSGFTSIDRITSGWQNGDLIIIAARPSMGKTAMALMLAKKTAEIGMPAGIFSLEMSKKQISGRYLSGASGYSNTELKTGRVDDYKKLCITAQSVAGLEIYVDDTPSLSLFELRSKAKKMVVRHGVKIIVVDYLQLMTAEAGSREQEVSTISRGLKAIAKELNIPVIALSQLNRGVEDRKERKPILSDLRESGAIEQDADIVSFIYRPAVYDIKSINIGNTNLDSEGLMIFDIAKNRNGATATLPLYHNISLTEITEEKIEDTVPY